MTSTAKGREHHLTIPAYDPLKVGTPSAILGEVASYMEMERTAVAEDLFGH